MCLKSSYYIGMIASSLPHVQSYTIFKWDLFACFP